MMVRTRQEATKIHAENVMASKKKKEKKRGTTVIKIQRLCLSFNFFAKGFALYVLKQQSECEINFLDTLLLFAGM